MMKRELTNKEDDQLFNLLQNYLNNISPTERRLIKAEITALISTAMQRAVDEETAILRASITSLSNELAKRTPSNRFAKASQTYIKELGLEGDLADNVNIAMQNYAQWFIDFSAKTIESLRAEVERLKGCEKIVSELAETNFSDDSLMQDIRDDARQWVKDNITKN